MRLTLQSDYALRLLMQVAAAGGRRVTIAEVAERFGISKNHLMKVAQTLGREGFLETVRGRSGGLRLARPPGEIRLGALLQSVEGGFALVECFPGGAGGCLLTPACRLKGVLGEAVTAFLEVLDRYTLDDLVTDNPMLKDLLNKEAA